MLYIKEHFHNHADDMECELFLALFHRFVLTVFIHFDLLLFLQAFITYEQQMNRLAVYILQITISLK
jgi:hypothetical protein